MGRFTDKENEIILENWESMCQICEISQPQGLIEIMKNKKNFKTVAQKRQRNIIGCYLGINLIPTRHGSDLFSHFTDILTSDRPKYKKFSHRDDQMILNEVAKKGEKLSTWKALSLKIRGDERTSWYIRERYKNKLSAESMKSGNFTLEEDTAILEHLFTSKPCAINTINRIQFSSFDNIKEVKRGKKYISQRFQLKM